MPVISSSRPLDRGFISSNTSAGLSGKLILADCSKRLAKALKMAKSDFDSPGASVALRTMLTLRSVLVNTPSFSAQVAAGK